MTNIKERPILFSAAMVRAILKNHKTQTRRIIKPVRGYEHNNVCCPGMAADPHAVWWHGKHWLAGCLQECPYGKPGDRLWVREACAILGRAVWYRADCDQGPADEVCAMSDGDLPPDSLRWRPSIHMPRWASRITLKIVSVKTERLQQITEADARAEGIIDGGCLNCGNSEPCGCSSPEPSARDAFCYLWGTINGSKSWHLDPYVWVIEFCKVNSHHEESTND